MFRRVVASLVIISMASGVLAGRARAEDDAEALKRRIAELEKRLAEMENLLKEKVAPPEAEAEAEEFPAGPVPVDKVPDWARKRIEELLDRGIRGEFNVPGFGDMRIETLPRASRARLGVHIEPLGEEEAAAVKLERGVRISRVEPDSPADEAGLRPGDILLDVDGERMETPDEVVETIGAAKPGDRAKLTILREGVEFKATATLAGGERGGPGRMPWGMRPFEEERDPFEMLRRHRFRLEPEWHLGGEAPPEANVETKIDTPDGRIHASVSAPTLTMPEATAKAMGLTGEVLKKAREALAEARAELARELNSAAGKVVGPGQASIDFSAVKKKLSQLEIQTARDLAKILTPEQMEQYRNWRAARQGFSHSLRIERGARGGAARPQIRGLQTF